MLEPDRGSTIYIEFQGPRENRKCRSATKIGRWKANGQPEVFGHHDRSVQWFDFGLPYVSMNMLISLSITLRNRTGEHCSAEESFFVRDDPM